MIAMPMYEYACARCAKNFEEIVFQGAATPACPGCAQHDEVTRIPFSNVSFGKKEDLRPPDIKSRLRPPRR
jgi:putative FmdB family regulatory protein